MYTSVCGGSIRNSMFNPEVNVQAAFSRNKQSRHSELQNPITLERKEIDKRFKFHFTRCFLYFHLISIIAY